MALTRKLLKGMGLTEEQVDTIIEAHADTVDGLKADVAKYKPDAEKLPGIQKELDDLKAAGDGGWKEKAEAAEKKYSDLVAENRQKETRTARETAYRALLKEAGISEKRIDAVLKVSDLNGVELDGSGAIIGADRLKESVRAEWADFIATTTTKGADTATPPANNPGPAEPKSLAEALRARYAQKG